MSDSDKHAPNTTPVKAAARAEREARLARALRDNLRRRKQQSQGRAENPPEPPAED